jgi:hypothetical protein
MSEEIERKTKEKEAIARAERWELMGCPTSPSHMVLTEYEQQFVNRRWFANKVVLNTAQETLSIIICPMCMEEDSRGGIKATPFYITVEDDVMTTFPAVGHFVCHRCGFEEWHPLKADPRRRDSATGEQIRAWQRAEQPKMQQVPYFGGPLNRAIGWEAQLEKTLGDINPGMGPIPGMTDAEKEALYRIYQSRTSPPILETANEIKLFEQLNPHEKRKFVVAKMRAKGMI